jgi:hypothetical protein
MQAAELGHTQRTSDRLHRAVFLLLATFLLLFPKGGIKLAGVPITWGYLLLGMFAAAAFVFALLSARLWKLRRSRLLTLAALLPFQLVSLLTFAANGVEGLGFTISFLVTFFFLPPVFVLLMAPYLDRLDANMLFRFLRVGILAVAAYGIFLFFFRMITGAFLEIPLLTVNLGDLGGLDEKYINRDGVFKLISTYNNGNIYGICMLMLLPLYGWIEQSRLRRGIVKFSLVLTISRTVWIGLVLYEVLSRMFIRRISARELASLVGVIALVGVIIAVIMSRLGVGIWFLLDTSLGGRAHQIDFVREARFLAVEPFSTIMEIVYLSVLRFFGIVGLATFLVAMTTPLALYLTGYVPSARSTFKRCVAVGMVIYLVIAASDGAILYIPVMAFYWFLVALLLSHNPGYSSWKPTQPSSPAAQRPRRPLVGFGTA